MKRKLVDYEVFTKMRENSLTTAVKELVEAEEHLARALDVSELKLSSFDESTVIYEQAGGNYLRANFSFDKDKIHFDNVEELVIDEETENQESRKIIRGMLEAVLDDKEVEAAGMFEKYINMVSNKQKRECVNCTESVIEEAYARLYGSPERTGGKSTPKLSVRSGSKNMKKSLAAKAAHRRYRTKYAAGARKRVRNKSKENSRRNTYKKLYSRLRALNSGKAYTGKRKKTMSEWIQTANNVYGYIDFVSNGHVISETKIHKADDGTTSVVMPNSKLRNESKVLKMHFDNMLKTDVKVLRESARRLANDQAFCRMVADVKRYNNISDNTNLEESITNLIKNYPGVLYLTQDELSKVVHVALESVGVRNYDDQICDFMAEGILRVAHDVYGDRVERIKKLAKVEFKDSDDNYLEFQKVVSDFFPTLDESTRLEMKMFEDLYNVAVDVRKIALESSNDVVRNEAQDFIEELEDVLNGRANPDLDLAADVADWLEDLAEGNVAGASDSWEVNKTPHHTTTGDHPQMAKNAKVPGHSAAHSDMYSDPAPMIGSDSNDLNHGDEARNRSWGNKGGKEVWPSLENPHVPSPFGDYKVKGEKSVVDEDGLGGEGGSDTWPNLKNPYIPQATAMRQKVQPDNTVE